MFVELENEIFQTMLELVQIEITGCCNMHCKHCRASAQPKKMISINQMEKIIDFIKKVKNDNFKLTFSGGEPFLNPNLYKYLKMVKENGLREIVITTNASLLDDKMLKKLDDLKLDFLCIQVSLDSINPEEHDKFRGYSGAFEKCCEVLEKIQFYDNINSSIRMTITPKTIKEINKMVDFALEKKVKILGIGSVIPFGRASDCNLSLNSVEKKKFINKILKLNKMYKGKLEIVTEDPLKFLNMYEANELTTDLNDNGVFGGCTAGISSLNINSDGVVTPCSMMSEEVMNINKCIDADEMINQYQNSKIIKDLFEKKFSGKCGLCPLKKICGGCRAAAKGYTSDILGSDLSCWRNVQ